MFFCKNTKALKKCRELIHCSLHFRIQYVWHWHRHHGVWILETIQLEQRKEVGDVMHFIGRGVVKVTAAIVFYRRLQIEELEARIALLPLLQAEQDRRWCWNLFQTLEKGERSLCVTTVFAFLQDLEDAERKPGRGSNRHERCARMEGKGVPDAFLSTPYKKMNRNYLKFTGIVIFNLQMTNISSKNEGLHFNYT